MALRSFPNRYLFSLHNKVTSLFSIRYILEIILRCKQTASPSPSERRGCIPAKLFFDSTNSLTPQPLSEWNNPTQPPPRGGMPNGSQLGEAYFNPKRAFLRCEETPSLMLRDVLLNSRRASLHSLLHGSR